MNMATPTKTAAKDTHVQKTTVEQELDRMRDAARREFYADVARGKLHARQLGVAWVRRHSVLLLSSGALVGGLAAASAVSRRAKRSNAGNACTDGKAEKHETSRSDTKSAIGSTLGSLARAWLANAFLSGSRD
jgi:hypothetical protein